MLKPLAIDLFCGLGGWTDGLLAEGYDVIGFDIERHQYGEHAYPAQLVIQDVLTLHGSQFRNAALIVASPPCQGYSYRAMPWKRAKALPPPCNALFDACFRIQREACEAAGRHIPLIVENVRGAQPWVGRARWNYGSFYLWGDVPALMPMTSAIKNNGGSWFNIGSPGQTVLNKNPVHELSGTKVPSFRFDGSGRSFQSASVRRTDPGKGARFTSRDCGLEAGKHASDDNGRKIGGDWFSDPQSTCRRHGSKSAGRKMASAMIAKIPLPLSRYLAATFRREATPC